MHPGEAWNQKGGKCAGSVSEPCHPRPLAGGSHRWLGWGTTTSSPSRQAMSMRDLTSSKETERTRKKKKTRAMMKVGVCAKGMEGRVSWAA